MQKRIFAAVLTMAMLFALVAINASAETQYDIRICNNDESDIDDAYTPITDDNASDVLGDGKVSFDSSSNTLTLDNATLSAAYWDNINISKSGTIKIVVKGNCSLTAGVEAILASAADKVIIEGEKDASLTICANNYGMCFERAGGTMDVEIKNLDITIKGSPDKGIYVGNGNLTIENCTIATITDLNGIYVKTGNVTVKDSILNIRASENGIGIYAGGDVTIISTYLKELSGKNAIKAKGTVSINESGGFVIAVGSDADRLAIDAASILMSDDMALKAGNDLLDAQTIDTSNSSESGGAKWSSYKYAQFSTKYTIKGDNPTWIKGSTDGATITSTASLSLFTAVKVDGHFVDESDYTATSGSTKVSFTPSYLETLDIGDHEVIIVSKTGTATGTLTIKEATKEEQTTTKTITETKTEDKVANTADNSAIATFVALTAFSATCFVSLKKKEK